MAAYLLNSPSEILAFCLVAKGVVSNFDANLEWPIAVGDEPNEPDNCVTTYDVGTASSGRDMVSGQQLEHYSIQVRIRSRTYSEGWVKINEIAKCLDEEVYLETVTITPNIYRLHSFSRRGGILSLGKEYPASQRSLFVMTGQCAIRQISPPMTKEPTHAANSRRTLGPRRS